MKVVILAGGFGTRLSEETDVRPKPMVEVGGKPCLWHIMKLYSHFGFNEFIICLGYKGYMIKEYFAHYFLHQCDVTYDFCSNEQIIHNKKVEPWKVTLVDTGLQTLTGGRIKRIRDYVGKSPFLLTYGDGVGDVNIAQVVKHHQERGILATVTAVQPAGRFGTLMIGENDSVRCFQEKPEGDGTWVNGGFFVLEPGVFDFVDGDDSVWEKDPMEKLAAQGQLTAYHHKGFWKPMDTLRDKIDLERMWSAGSAPWKLWQD